MKTFTITTNEAGQRVDKWVSKIAPKLPSSLLYKSIRLKRIKVNGRRTEIGARLQPGDRVDMYVGDEFFTGQEEKYDFLLASPHVHILFEDENILLADKPQGLLSHPDKNEFTDTLITRIKRYLYEKGEYDPESAGSFAPALCNRIDRNTGGIVIAAKNAEALRVMNEKIKAREIRKFYYCFVEGKMKKPAATLTGFLSKDEDKNQVQIYSTGGADRPEIVTRYRVISERTLDRRAVSLLEVELLTGRTHQIRAHFASIGHPLLGDGKYGNNLWARHLGFTHQALYAYRLAFCFTTDAGTLNYLNGQEFTVENVWFLGLGDETPRLKTKN